MVIRSFGDTATERIWNEERVKGFDVASQRVALRKLELLHAATSLEDLRVPPGNRLELLRGDRKGQHSIGVNDQWRVCCAWGDGGADGVELVDLH